MVSVVILNFDRPNFIKQDIIPKLLKYKEVKEIIISNGKDSTYIEDRRVKCLNHTGEVNDVYGLTLRFYAALEASEDNILIMDDDIIPSEATVNYLNAYLDEDPDRIYGIYGRSLKDGYSYENVFGEVSVVLTRCLICRKEMCQYFMDEYKKYENELVKDAKPYWNGEDILFSLLSIKKYGKLPIAFDMSHYNRIANYVGTGGISLNGGHNKYRKDVSKKWLYDLDIQDKVNTEKIEKKKEQLKYFMENSNLYIIFILIIFAVIYFLYNKIYEFNGKKLSLF